jgi:ribosomal protein S18 acetylase RimI-like enzyme
MNSTIKIRKAKLKDSAQIAEIQRQAFNETIQHYFGSDTSSKKQVKTFTDDLYKLIVKSLKDEVLVAEVDDKVVGDIMVPYDMRRSRRSVMGYRIFYLVIARALLTMATMSCDNRKVLMSDRGFMQELYNTDFGKEVHSRVFNIAVLPEYQGQGIGKTLMKKGLQYLFNERGAHAVALNVMKDNENALGIYQSFGFREVRRINNSLGEWIVMCLDRDVWLTSKKI